MDAQVAKVLLDFISLVQAGFEFNALANKAKELIALGKTDNEINDYFHNLRVATLNEGTEFFKTAKPS